ncbi:putative MFS-type transporterc [Vanrija pseudolonga]|uniref:Purtative MFS-type transporterc n=1 Tax=Vanrija pseudolonga TaxID=143232 RepID=A0AAF1BHL5_9TREE|nr:purtative MFS-type transporterc [Vanrija pseudolonga]
MLPRDTPSTPTSATAPRPKSTAPTTAQSTSRPPLNHHASAASLTRSRATSPTRVVRRDSEQSESSSSSGDSAADAAVREAIGEERERGLEETLEQLGFGPYQWRLFALCGCGWMSDNAALVCVAVILPRVRIHWDLSEKLVGVLSASTMAGMMAGSVAWGVVSDLAGRALPFNATLLLTAVFTISASFSPSFLVLCFWMFCMGTAVGGSMPTDGTLFIENLPHSKQYLLTVLSLFFSFGAVVSSLIGYALLPGASCIAHEGCDIKGGDNNGWRHVLLGLGCINLLCALSRVVLFRLHESPRFLVSNGREQEAVVVLRAIANFNDNTIDIQRDDVRQTEQTTLDPVSTAVVDTNGVARDPEEQHSLINGHRDEDGFIENPPHYEGVPGDDMYSVPPSELPSPVHHRRRKHHPHHQQQYHGRWAWLHKWIAQVARLFTPKWRRTVILMWIIWGAMSLAYTMFNVWLPTVLEMKQKEGTDKIKGSLNDVVLYALAGCPGSAIGAYMIQTKLGRRKSLALCTLATCISVFAFIPVTAKSAMVVSSMFISLTGTAMYAVLYGMTPETFNTSIRGTACGTAAAISRLTGVIAPVLAGFLLSIHHSLPLYVSAIVYMITVGCSLGLPKGRNKGSGGGAVMH